MRPRTYARAIAFQVLYREDLNPQDAPEIQDQLLEQGRSTKELIGFVRHLIEMHDPGDAGSEEDWALAQQWLRTPSLVEFSRALIAGVLAHRSELDEQIGQAAANWSLDRMAATDRNLLRLGAYELLHTEVPAKVAVDEAVELAKRFGGAQSAQFVNGILDKLMHKPQDPLPGPQPLTSNP